MVEVLEVVAPMSNSWTPKQCVVTIFLSKLDLGNKGVADQPVRGEIIQYSFDIASTLLEEITKTNRSW